MGYGWDARRLRGTPLDCLANHDGERRHPSSHASNFFLRLASAMIRLSPPGLAPRRVPSKSNESRKQTEELYRHLVRRIGIAHEPGVARRLRRLHKRGWQQAIASAAPRANIDAVLEALSASHIFQSIVSAEDVHRGKPDPEVYLLAASRVGVAAERSIVVEDASAESKGGAAPACGHWGKSQR